MTRYSGTQESNPEIHDWTEEYKERDNEAFFAAAFRELAGREGWNGGLMTIGLLGQRDLPGVMLRRAQAALRWDLRPSLWSHAFLVADRVATDGAELDTPVREVAIYQRRGKFPEPLHNAVSEGRLSDY